MARSRQKLNKVASVPLKQLQYRSYKYTILIYHYDKSLLSFQRFQASLCRGQHGFVVGLVSPIDRIAISHPPREGDEVPLCKLEVAYLPNIFQGRGSALGFRIPSKDASKLNIHWLCFNQPIDVLDSLTAPSGARLFDKVAFLEKGGCGKKGAIDGVKEHIDWHKSLSEAEHPRTGLTLEEAYDKFERDAKKAMLETAKQEKKAQPSIRLVSRAVYNETAGESESESEDERGTLSAPTVV